MADTVFFFVVAGLAALSFTFKDYALGRSDALLSRAALLCTASADFFMLIFRSDTVGLLFFILVQLIYHIRYLPRRAIPFYMLIELAVCSLAFLVLKALVPLDTALAAVYGICFLFSVSASIRFRTRWPMPNQLMIPAGMVLFFLCDINVGLYNIFSYRPAFRVLFWIFYLPSQALLSVSAKRFAGAERMIIGNGRRNRAR
ncbi:MAG: lysoplasmalogenase family protein [Clostridiales bacterium]|jgi:hypothetical protein|nr:lysoplasmalogenase family protein [Clostridiales bacterium]